MTVEHRHESFVVVRKGRSIARIVPESGTSGGDVKELLRTHPADTGWAEDLRELRSMLEGEERWNG